MIKTIFKTNLDLHHCEKFEPVEGWVPRVGEYVESSYKFHSGTNFVLSLEVCSVTYGTEEGVVVAELHLPKNGRLGKTINEFTERYSKITGLTYFG